MLLCEWTMKILGGVKKARHKRTNVVRLHLFEISSEESHSWLENFVWLFKPDHRASQRLSPSGLMGMHGSAVVGRSFPPPQGSGSGLAGAPRSPRRVAVRDSSPWLAALLAQVSSWPRCLPCCLEQRSPAVRLLYGRIGGTPGLFLQWDSVLSPFPLWALYLIYPLTRVHKPAFCWDSLHRKMTLHLCYPPDPQQVHRFTEEDGTGGVRGCSSFTFFLYHLVSD